MKFQPMDDYLMVEKPERAKSSRRIDLPDTIQRPQDYTPNRGVVLAVGPGRLLANGNYLSLPVRVGDIAVWNPMAGVITKIEGQEYLVLHIGDLYGVAVEDDEEYGEGHPLQDTSAMPLTVGREEVPGYVEMGGAPDDDELADLRALKEQRLELLGDADSNPAAKGV